MVDADDVRRIALALPQVAEIESDGFDFRVADKGFVWSYPEIFFTTSSYDGWPLVMRAPEDMVRELDDGFSVTA